MHSAALAVGGVICGCQANVFLLELIMAGNPGTFYALTFAQYVVVALLSLPLVCTIDLPPSRTSWMPLRLRSTRILTSHKIFLSIFAWIMSVSSNLVFDFYISVPVHATFRSLSLLLNMLAGYYYLGKHYTFLQVACSLMISVSLVVLTVEKSRKIEGSGDAAKGTHVEELFWWLCGVVVLACTTVFSTGLSIFQEYMYTAARRREKKEDSPRNPKDAIAFSSLPSSPPMWAEALFFSHAFGILLFFLHPSRLLSEFMSISSTSYTHFIMNAMTQYICVAGVYVLNDKTSSFTVVLTLTLRKLGTFVVSVLYFRHYLNFNALEWVAMLSALLAGSLYPFLSKSRAKPPVILSAVQSKMGQ